MPVLFVFGNSGSGKSTLAKRLSLECSLAHLDLDTLAWQPGMPPVRREISASIAELNDFLDGNADCVIEGCYADLFTAIAFRCTKMIFLDPGVDACVTNARARPWEPHKYPSKEAQDANLAMLIGWIRDYETRTDEFSRAAHHRLFDGFVGDKVRLTTRDAIRTFTMATGLEQ